MNWESEDGKRNDWFVVLEFVALCIAVWYVADDMVLAGEHYIAAAVLVVAFMWWSKDR